MEGSQALISGFETESSPRLIPFTEEAVEQSLPSRFEDQVRKFPERLAIKTKKGAFTYRELNRAANGIARAILHRCGSGLQPVACLFSDDALWVATILGILKAGKFYVSLDPEHPPSRTEQVWREAQPVLLATDTTNLETGRQLSGAVEPLNVESLNNFSGENLGLSVSSDSLACILFTSGSTGQPKGVVHSHRSILHNIKNHTNTLHITADDRLSLLSSRTTAQAVTGTYSALLNGAALCFFRFKEEGLERLARWLSDEQITIYHSSASTFRHFAASLTGKSLFPRLRVAKLGSEPVSSRELQLFKAHFSPSCLFVNALSSTETFMIRQYCTRNGAVDGNLVPAGYNVPDMEVLVLGEDGQPVGTGEVGEIVVRSRYLAVGYWQKPEETKAAFAPDSAGSDLRSFRTGDIGRVLPDGALVHLGRKGSRVKIRGNRVELAEVEAALLTVPGVRQAVVAAQEDERGNRVLVAYVVPTAKDATAPVVLRRALRERLPRYMVPSLFILLDELPVTPQGKIDRRAVQQQRAKVDSDEPRDDTEAQLVELWKGLLKVDHVGIRDDFFDLGGDSLLAASLLFQIEQAFGKELFPSILADDATIERLASTLVEQWTAEPSPWLVAGKQSASHTPFFYLHGDYSGAGLYSIRLARFLGEEFPFYALQPLKRFETPLPASIEAMASAHLETLLSVQPHGPYLLGGYCNGGLVAFELAQQLLRRGEAVDLLFIFDTVVHNSKTSLASKLLRLAAKVPNLNEEETRDLVLRKNLFSAYWKEISGRERLQFVLDNRAMIADEAAKWLRRTFARNGQRERAELRPCAPAASNARSGFEEKQAEYTFHFRRLVRGYVAQPYSAPITLLVSEGRTGAHSDPTLGWGKVSPQVDFHMVPGDHHTCLTRHLNTVAEILRSCLERARLQQTLRSK
ncbi:MAG TPA: AMP-binding protein [Terriglobales bacterium]|nr:AMP-binding protein [Terriglobales bacterium]